MFEGIMIPLDQLVQYLGITAAIETILLIAIWFTSGDLVYVWFMAWYKKVPICLEWTKNKFWKFKLPEIPKGVPELWELDKKTRVVEVRRTAVGIAPHKVPMMLTVSEFPATISPSEVNGDRMFVPQEAFYGVLFNGEVHRVYEPTEKELQELNKLSNNNCRTAEEDMIYTQLYGKVEAWNAKKLWVKYPEHGLTIEEFVSFQKVSTDPRHVSAYGRQLALDAKISNYSIGRVLLDNPMPIVILLIGAAIAMVYLNNNNAAIAAQNSLMACKDQLANYVHTGGNIIASNIPVNVSALPPGGAVVAAPTTTIPFQQFIPR